MVGASAVNATMAKTRLYFSHDSNEIITFHVKCMHDPGDSTNCSMLGSSTAHSNSLAATANTNVSSIHRCVCVCMCDTLCICVNGSCKGHYQNASARGEVAFLEQ